MAGAGRRSSLIPRRAEVVQRFELPRLAHFHRELEPQAQLAHFDGLVYEIEIGNGQMNGFFEVGLELSVPGTYDPPSNRLYVPASHTRIYVLAEHHC